MSHSDLQAVIDAVIRGDILPSQAVRDFEEARHSVPRVNPAKQRLRDKEHRAKLAQRDRAGAQVNADLKKVEARWEQYKGVPVLRSPKAPIAAVPVTGRKNARQFIAFVVGSDMYITSLKKTEVEGWLNRAALAYLRGDADAYKGSITHAKRDGVRVNFAALTESEEGSYGDARKLAKKIEAAYKRIFPKSWISAEFDTAIMPSVTVKHTLGNGKSEYVNGIWHNDPALHIWVLHAGRDGVDGTTFVKPINVSRTSDKLKDKNHRPVGRKIPFRKVTGDVDTVVKALVGYWKRLKKKIADNADQIQSDRLPFDVKSKV